MIICLGPVCVPLHLLLPFLVAMAHQHGYLTWFKRDWVTFKWYKEQCNRLLGRKVEPAGGAAGPAQGQAKCCAETAAEGPTSAPAAASNGAQESGGTSSKAAAATSTAVAGSSSIELRSRAAPSSS